MTDPAPMEWDEDHPTFDAPGPAYYFVGFVPTGVPEGYRGWDSVSRCVSGWPPRAPHVPT